MNDEVTIGPRLRISRDSCISLLKYIEDPEIVKKYVNTNLDVRSAATIFMHQLPQSTRIVARLSRIYVYMYVHIQRDSSKFRVFGDGYTWEQLAFLLNK